MTIKDLAKETGYGVATVSRVLNNHPNVSEKARRSILQAVERSGFQINENAKQLKQQRPTSILIVVKGTSNEMFGALVEAIQSRIAETDYPLVVDYIDENANEVLRAVTLCREKKPKGILFLGGNSDHFIMDFDKIEIPCVLVSNSAENLDFDNLSSVCTDDRAAAKKAMDSLFELGHKKLLWSAVIRKFPIREDSDLRGALIPALSTERALIQSLITAASDSLIRTDMTQQKALSIAKGNLLRFSLRRMLWPLEP